MHHTAVFKQPVFGIITNSKQQQQKTNERPKVTTTRSVPVIILLVRGHATIRVDRVILRRWDVDSSRMRMGIWIILEVIKQ